MTRSLPTLVLLLLAAIPARATSLDLGLNNDSAQVEVTQTLGADSLGASILGGRFLYNDDKGTKLGSIGFEFVGEPGNIAGLKIGIGADSEESCQSFQRKVATCSTAKLPVIGAQRRWSFCLTPSRGSGQGAIVVCASILLSG